MTASRPRPLDGGPWPRRSAGDIIESSRR